MEAKLCRNYYEATPLRWTKIWPLLPTIKIYMKMVAPRQSDESTNVFLL